MYTRFNANITIPTQEECDLIAQQVIREAQSVFANGGVMLGQALVNEIANRISERTMVNVTAIPMHEDPRTMSERSQDARARLGAMGYAAP